MKREELLERIKMECARKGYVSSETEEIFRQTRCSKTAYDRACYQGRQIREEIYNKHRVWELQEKEHKFREGLKRALSCGDRLDTEANKDLIDRYHKAQEAYKEAARLADKECEAL